MGAVLLAITVAGLGCTPPGNPKPILDAQDRMVVYHGLNVSSYQKGSEGYQPWHTPQDFARMKEWGFNLVRYLVFWEAIEPSSGEYDDRYLNATIQRIRWMQELGIDVLIDLHQDLYNRKFGGNGFPDWTVNDDGHAFTARQPWNRNYFEPAVMACYNNFWRSEVLKKSYVEMTQHLLRKLEGLPNVVGVEIMNEPWPHVGSGFEQGYLTRFYEDVEAMKIRNGFTTPLYFEPVIFTSAGVPSALRFEPETNAVYAAHYYDPWCHEGQPYRKRGRRLMKFALHRRIEEAHRAGTPLIYTEFGISPEVKGYRDFLDDLIDLLDEHQVSWVYYCYDTSSADSFGIIDETGATRPNFDPLVRLYPQRIAGRNARWTRQDHRFELQYEPVDTAAPTVIFVPRSVQPTRVLINGVETPFDHQRSLCFEYTHGNARGQQTIVIEWR